MTAAFDVESLVRSMVDDALAEFAGRRTITVEEAARVLGIGRSAAYDATARGDIPTIRLGRRIVVPVAALAGMLLGGAT